MQERPSSSRMTLYVRSGSEPTGRMNDAVVRRRVLGEPLRPRSRRASARRCRSRSPSWWSAALARSIRFVPQDEFGDLLDHLFLDAGIAVLGKGAAWIGRHRMTVLESSGRQAQRAGDRRGDGRADPRRRGVARRSRAVRAGALAGVTAGRDRPCSVSTSVPGKTREGIVGVLKAVQRCVSA